MATITYRHFNDDGWIDEEGHSSPTLAYMLLEENGVEFAYRPAFKTYCQAIDIDEGVENVVIPDEIEISGVGKCIVKECWTAIRSTDKLRKIKQLTIGKNVSKIGFWQYNQLERLTIPESLRSSIDTFIEQSPELVSITVKGDGKDEHITPGKIRMIEADNIVKRQKEEKEKERIQKEKEHEEKFRDFSNYKKKMSSISAWYLAIVCAIPYLYVAGVWLTKINGFGEFIGWCVVLFGLFIGWAMACYMSFYAEYISEDNVLVKLFCPIVTVPLSWIILFIGVNILTLFTSCSLWGILDPRFL